MVVSVYIYIYTYKIYKLLLSKRVLLIVSISYYLTYLSYLLKYLSWLHFKDEPRVHTRQQVKNQQFL